MKLNSTFCIWKARKFRPVSSRARFTNPLMMNAIPRTMLRVEAKLPPTTMPTKSSSPTQMDRMLSAPLVFRPATVSPPVSKMPMRSMSPRMPNATRTRPIRPAPTRYTWLRRWSTGRCSSRRVALRREDTPRRRVGRRTCVAMTASFGRVRPGTPRRKPLSTSRIGLPAAWDKSGRSVTPVVVRRGVHAPPPRSSRIAETTRVAVCRTASVSVRKCQ